MRKHADKCAEILYSPKHNGNIRAFIALVSFIGLTVYLFLYHWKGF